MRVKVGATWYEASTDQPVMVMLTMQDRRNIESMPPDYRCYADFGDDDHRSEGEKLRWMKEGMPS